MKVNRVEQHIIKKVHPSWKLVDDLCFKSKNLYNYANYIIRQEFINNNRWIHYNELFQLCKESESYKEIGSNVGQQTLKILDKSWESFFKTIKDWQKNPDKYLGRPKLPKYKDKEKGRNILGIDNIKFSIKDGYLRFSWSKLKPLNNIFKTNAYNRLMQVRFVPKRSHYVMEIVYEINVPETCLDQNRIIGIDLGINNFATISNNSGLMPFIINGKTIKSMNQYYNKKKAKLQSDLKLKHNKNWSNRLQQLTNKRNNKINDYIHKSSKYIVDWCIKNQIDTVIIGLNKGWKQESKMSKKVNQNFVGIPYDLFIQKLQYKCENVGIKFIDTEESYTSGTSFLDSELPTKENYNKARRIHRGLFQSNKKTLINADLNGAYQIIKKVIPNAFAEGIEGVGLHPVRINL
ncbi:MAG: transposase [Bacilli bacterium]|nr:transposase [Bacilli bacterium]